MSILAAPRVERLRTKSYEVRGVTRRWGLQEELAEAREALAGEMVGAQMVQGELASAREAALQSDQDQQRLTEELATARASLAEAEAALAAPCASADSGEGTETEHLQAELAATRLKLQAARVAAADGHGAAEECTQLRATLTDVRAALKEAQVEAAAARERCVSPARQRLGSGSRAGRGRPARPHVQRRN